MKSVKHAPRQAISCELDLEEFKIFKFYSRKVGCPIAQLVRGILRQSLRTLETMPYKPERIEKLQDLVVIGQDINLPSDETVKDTSFTGAVFEGLNTSLEAITSQPTVSK